MLPFKKSALKLFQDGAEALATVEHNGIRIDEYYFQETKIKIEKEIKDLQADQQKSEIGKTWKKKYRTKTNFSSNDQLGDILFKELGYEPIKRTATGKASVDESSLNSLDIPFVSNLLKIRKLQKVSSTNIDGLMREAVGGIIHPFFNLHRVRTFRSSSDSPNFQNLPIRDSVIGPMIRKGFVARPGRRLIEFDYSGVEVRVAACYHKDPNMIAYIKDPSKDMHRDSARDCFMLPAKEMLNPVDSKDTKRIKTIRYCGKNMFVFPQFYGDWYKDCAESLWAAIDDMGLHTRNGDSLKIHLMNKGISELGEVIDYDVEPGTFMHHIQQVEKKFWNKRFKVYNQWRKDWVEEYNRNGYILTKTGFICQGFMKRNEIINYAVQGAAFHCLLWSLIEIVKELRRQKMKSLIVGQIHDSIVGDVLEEEKRDFLQMVKYIMTERLVKTWKWIIVPLEVEAEASPLNGTWADKKEIEI